MASIDQLKASDGSGSASLSTVQNVRSPGAATIIVNTVSGINTNFIGSMGTPHTFTDPVTSETITVISEATNVDFKGHVDGTDLVIDEIADGQTDLGSEVGDIIIIKPTTQWADKLAEVLEVAHNDDGTLKAIVNTPGWTEITASVNSVATGYNSGNRSFQIDTSEDLSGVLSPGMRYKVTRDTTPPVQCADLEASSSQYASKSSPTGMTLTTTISAEAWIKLESYGTRIIISRHTTSGWIFNLNSNGQVILLGDSAAGTADQVLSIQSVPLGKWTHVAGTMTINTGGAIYIDGVSVPVEYTNGTTTDIEELGNLELGSFNGGTSLFDGKLSDVRVWSDIRTETEIQDNMYGYPSDTTGLVAHFKLAGDFTDSSSNANDLTASGGAVATDVDNPWNATEYGIITAVSASDIQVFCPSGYGIPNETLTAPFYSTQSTPFGFPRDKGLWSIRVNYLADIDASATTSNVWLDTSADFAGIPIGAWDFRYRLGQRVSTGASGVPSGFVTLSTTTNSDELLDFTTGYQLGLTAASITAYLEHVLPPTAINLTTQTTFNILLYTGAIGATVNRLNKSVTQGSAYIIAECAYL